MSNGFSAMGYGLPVAIGAKLACPDKRVLAICGDGGFLMSCQEMGKNLIYKLTFRNCKEVGNEHHCHGLGGQSLWCH